MQVSVSSSDDHLPGVAGRLRRRRQRDVHDVRRDAGRAHMARQLKIDQMISLLKAESGEACDASGEADGPPAARPVKRAKVAPKVFPHSVMIRCCGSGRAVDENGSPLGLGAFRPCRDEITWSDCISFLEVLREMFGHSVEVCFMAVDLYMRYCHSDRSPRSGDCEGPVVYLRAGGWRPGVDPVRRVVLTLLVACYYVAHKNIEDDVCATEMFCSGTDYLVGREDLLDLEVQVLKAVGYAVGSLRRRSSPDTVEMSPWSLLYSVHVPRFSSPFDTGSFGGGLTVDGSGDPGCDTRLYFKHAIMCLALCSYRVVTCYDWADIYAAVDSMVETICRPAHGRLSFYIANASDRVKLGADAPERGTAGRSSFYLSTEAALARSIVLMLKSRDGVRAACESRRRVERLSPLPADHAERLAAYRRCVDCAEEIFLSVVRPLHLWWRRQPAGDEPPPPAPPFHERTDLYETCHRLPYIYCKKINDTYDNMTWSGPYHKT